MKFKSPKQPVWHKKTVKLQITKEGYPHINLPKDSVRRAKWPDNAIVEVDEDEDGRIILTNIRR